jgi:hypothetical protein
MHTSRWRSNEWIMEDMWDIKLVYFLKFVVHKINSKMIKFEMVVLTER